MKADVIEVMDPKQPQNQLLRGRAARCRMRFSTQYLELVEGKEAAFLSFDDKSTIGVGVGDEIVVLPEFQGQGLGGQLLALGESLARDCGCKRVVLMPKKVEDGLSQAKLEAWYQRHGFTWASNGMEMEKFIDAGTT
jgi:GNAT superfamily N-acetyltransferase